MNKDSTEIYNFILHEIVNKRLQAGKRLPTEVELSNRFKTNRMNAHFALKQLKIDGIVERKKRTGTFVHQPVDMDVIHNLQHKAAVTIHVLVGDSSPGGFFNQWNEKIIDNLEVLFKDYNMELSYRKLPDNRIALKDYLDTVRSSGVRCLIILPAKPEDFLIGSDLYGNCTIPVLLVNQGIIPAHKITCHSINLPPYEEGVIAAEYVYEKKFSHPLFLQDEINSRQDWAKGRIEGLKDTLNTLTAGTVKMKVLCGPEEKIFSDACALLSKQGKAKTVIIGQNDTLSAAFVNYAASKKMETPRDYYFLAFDNGSKYRYYNLTTVVSSEDEIPNIILKLITENRLNDFSNAKLQIAIRPELIKRHSC
jgi:DNA-binding LacI/PurR family transcriptional regulator